jgi:hypothetical protein
MTKFIGSYLLTPHAIILLGQPGAKGEAGTPGNNKF